MNSILTLGEYLSKNKKFIIPEYQRGYVWGQKSKNGDAVSCILNETLLPGFHNNKSIFIQGITVNEQEDKIVLIDGQQRTTFFYLLLKVLGYNKTFDIHYQIRNESDNFLKSYKLGDDVAKNDNEEFQDIYYFKKSLRIINNTISKSNINKNDFLDYVLSNVKFLYIDIPEDKALKVFTMMNGSKAQMKDAELIKAELLRLVSLNDKEFDKKNDSEKNSIEWENSLIRSRYAREWDRWLQWWNKTDVKKLYKDSRGMGYLIATCLLTEKQISQSYRTFKDVYRTFKYIFFPQEEKKLAICTFDKLRSIQKRFEDAFNDPIVYNKIGAILRIVNPRDKTSFIKWYFSSNKINDNELDTFYKDVFIGMTYSEIESKDDEKKAERFEVLLGNLSSNNLYYDYPDDAFKLLLRLNIDEDNRQENGVGRKFDFDIWDRNDSRGRSLEHIYPKSKVWHLNELGDILNGSDELIDQSSIDSSFIKREDCKFDNNGTEYMASEHSIGNLVLLYKDDNSTLSNYSFEAKKGIFFQRPDANKKTEIFKSRHLLHTIYKFANSKWGGEDIAKNKCETLKELEEYYAK